MTKCGQYVQGHVAGPNDTDVKRTVDSLYIGRNDNGSGHWVFKLDTKERVSVNRVTVTKPYEARLKRVLSCSTRFYVDYSRLWA